MSNYFKDESSSYLNKYISNHSYTPRKMTTNNIKHTDCLYLYLTGIKSYNSGRSLISIDLGKSSGGISINTNTAGSFGVKGYTPNSFKIDEAYIFAAVKYNGKWKGIRVHEK